MIEILDTFLATCKVEPRGDKGLEGYSLNTQYWVQLVKTNTINYARVFPTSINKPNRRTTRYYETCSQRTLKEYFTK
jgi:hypothetical protein